MFSVVESPEIRSRDEFADLCNKYQLFEAAEIGVDRAVFALEFLKRWKGYTLLLIDPYEPYENMKWYRSFDKHTAMIRMAPYADHVRFIPYRSPEAATQIREEWHLQFVYIDADHEYEAVVADLEAWWNRLDGGGILAGHDFIKGNGVHRAVIEFAQRRDLTVYHTTEGGTPISFYMFKS